MINIKNLVPNNIKIDEESVKNIIYGIGYGIANSIKPLYVNIIKVNGCIDENNGYRYLTLVHTDNGKDTLKSKETLPLYRERA